MLLIRMKEDKKEMSAQDKILAKHKGLTSEQVKTQLKAAEDRRSKLASDNQDFEANLTVFLNKLDPLVDPGTGNVIAWLKALPYKTILELTPKALQDAALRGEIPMELVDEARAQSYIMMSEIIAKPKKTPQEWETVATAEFIAIFDMAVYEMMARLSEKTDFF